MHHAALSRSHCDGEPADSLRNRIRAYRQMKGAQAEQEELLASLQSRKERQLWRVRESERRRAHITDTVDTILLSDVMESAFDVADIFENPSTVVPEAAPYRSRSPSHGRRDVGTIASMHEERRASVVAHSYQNALDSTGRGEDCQNALHLGEISYVGSTSSVFLSRALPRGALLNIDPDIDADREFIAGLNDTGTGGSFDYRAPVAVRNADSFGVDEPLADCMFVVGPSRDDIMSALDQHATMRPADAAPHAPSLHAARSYQLSPIMLFTTSTNPDVVSEILPSFCFPNDIDTLVRPVGAYVGDSTAAPNYFALQLTGNKQNKYIIGMQFSRYFHSDSNEWQLRTFYSVCLISSHPYFLFFFDMFAKLLRIGCFDMGSPLLAQVATYPLPTELRCVEEVALKLTRQPGVSSDGNLKFTLGFRGHKVDASLYNLNRFVRFDSRSSQEITYVRANYYILQWALPLLLSSIPVDQIVFILGCILTEMKVVVKCKDTGVLSACIWGLVSLLRPFHWVCPLIVVLPQSLKEYIDSIVPIIVGIVTTDDSAQVNASSWRGGDDVGPAPGLLVVDINNRKTVLDPSDVVLSHTLKIPDSSKLLLALKQPTENILRHLKLRRRRRSSLGNQRRSRTNSSASVGATVPRTSPQGATTTSSTQQSLLSVSSDDQRDGEEVSPLPRRNGAGKSRQRSESSLLTDVLPTGSPDAELDSSLVEDIVAFSDAVAAHMTIVANTAIQLCWDNQAQRRRQRRDLLNAPRERSASDTSINSSDVSGSLLAETLPPVKPFAPTFTTPRKLGNATLSFLNKFKDTQLFWQYCQRENEEVAALSGAGGIDSRGDVSLRANPGNEQFLLLRSVKSESSRMKDSIDALFTSMLTGSVPLDPGYLNSVCKRHDGHISDLHLEIESMRHFSEQSYFTSPEVRDDFFELETRLSCHGRCMGKADTAACSLLCVKLWEAEASYSYRVQEARRIIRHRQFTDSFANNKVTTSSGKTFVFPRITPGKHKMEVDAQYKARMRLIRGETPSDSVRVSEPKTRKISSIMREYVRKKNAVLIYRDRLVAAHKISYFMLACIRRRQYLLKQIAARNIQLFWHASKKCEALKLIALDDFYKMAMNLVPRSKIVKPFSNNSVNDMDKNVRNTPKLEFRSDSAPTVFETQGQLEDTYKDHVQYNPKLQSRSSSFDIYTSKLQEPLPSRDFFNFPRAPQGLLPLLFFKMLVFK